MGNLVWYHAVICSHIPGLSVQLLKKPDIFSDFNKVEKIFKFSILLFYAIARYGRNITLAN